MIAASFVSVAIVVIEFRGMFGASENFTLKQTATLCEAVCGWFCKRNNCGSQVLKANYCFVTVKFCMPQPIVRMLAANFVSVAIAVLEFWDQFLCSAPLKNFA